jgi:predicted acylesterase/phospholipase RssA
MMRLSELFNVNHFIVCQVNPHIMPFLTDQLSLIPSRCSSAISSLGFLFKSELQHRLSQLIEMEIFPTTLQKLQNVLTQRYYGDITIVPKVSLMDYVNVLSNPSRDYLLESIYRGVFNLKRKDYPLINMNR